MFTFYNQAIAALLAVAAYHGSLSVWAFVRSYVSSTHSVLVVGDLEQNVYKRIRVSPDTGLIRELRQFKLWLSLFTLAFLVSFALAYYNECEVLAAEIELARQQRPPLNCGPLSRRFEDLDWREWLMHTIDDRSAEECHKWIQRLHRSTWASPLHVLVKLFAQAIGEPILVWMDVLGKGLRSILSQHNLLLQIALLGATVLLIVLLVKAVLFARIVGSARSQSLPFYEQPQSPKVKLLQQN